MAYCILSGKMGLPDTYNHTQFHNAEKINGNIGSVDMWSEEISGANADLLKQSKIPGSVITGFRTPFLEYRDATFQAMVKNGIVYDCSIEHGLGQYQLTSGAWVLGMIWPYTLDEGPHISAFAKAQPKIPGFWELPVHKFYFFPESSNTGLTGLDWNVWFGAGNGKLSAEGAVDLWKHSLDMRIVGDSVNSVVPNKCPFFIGMHSDEYTDDNEANAKATVPTAGRRAAVSEFLDWALQYDPSIRVVPMNVVVDWMKDPVPYSQFHWKPDVISAVVQNEVVFATPILSAKFSGRKLSLTVPISGKSKIKIYNVAGALITDLGKINLGVGKNILPTGNNMAKGIYILKISGKHNGVVLIGRD